MKPVPKFSIVAGGEGAMDEGEVGFREAVAASGVSELLA
jgi:hypothetical protein